MILANFDLSFFTSIPGMLITGGVLLLLIALIIFIATGSKGEKKDKKNKKEEGISETATTPIVDNQVVTTNEPVVTMPNVENNAVPTVDVPVDQSEKVSIVENNSDMNIPSVDAVMPDVVNTNNEVKKEEVIPSMQPTVEVPVNPVEVNTSEVAVEQPVNQVNVMPEAIVANNEVKAEESIPSIQPTEVANTNEAVVEEKAIYGGVSPVIPNIGVATEQHRPIYGGANPLENTQSIPINNTVTEQPVIPVVTQSPVINDDLPKVEAKNTVNAQVEIPVANNVETNQVQEEVTPKVEVSVPKEEIESLF